MTLCFRSCVTLALLFASASLTLADDDPHAVKVAQHDNHLEVSVGGKPFTSYWFGKRPDRPYVRPFFFPVLAVGEVPLTSDQYTAHGDHPHHQSLYVAQGDVNGADHWALKGDGTDSPKQVHVKFDKVDDEGFVEELEWEGKDHQPILKEKRTVHFLAMPDGSRGIDITSAFTPVDGPVTFGDTKEAGLCAVRMTHAISDNHPVITTAAGQTGEKETWGKPADWCDTSGTIAGKNYGIAILDAPSNPRHPATWHVREYGLMAANIFGLSDFDKSKPKHAGDFTIEKGKTVTFRHRVIVHPGNASEVKLGEKYKEFTSGK